MSFDQKIPVGRYDYFGFGGTFWGDKAGSLDFSTIQFKLSGSYSKRMAGTRTSAQYLVFGAEASIFITPCGEIRSPLVAQILIYPETQRFLIQGSCLLT